MKIKISERDVKQKLRSKLRALICSKFVSYTPYPFGEPGTPDLIGCVNGKMVLIEVKTKGGKLTTLQELRISQWRKVGADVYVVNNIDEIENLMTALKNY